MKPAVKPGLLILTSSFPRSALDGTCGYVREFADSLSACFDVTVLAPGDLSDDSSYRSFKVERSRPVLAQLSPAHSTFRASADLNEVIARGALAWLALLPGLIAFTFRAIRLALRSNVICSHWMAPSGVIGAICSKALQRPHIVVEHSGALHLLRKTRLGKLLARFVVRNSRTVVVVSEDLRTKLLEFCPRAVDKIVVIPMGVDSDRLEGQRPAVHASVGKGATKSPIESCLSALPVDTPRTILFVGRLVKIKGVDSLLRAAALTKNLRVVIAGDGPERPNLERLAAELGIDAEFKGAVSGKDKFDVYRLAGAVVIPSLVLDSGRSEGTPRVGLEAMASGIPVIASRCGGLPEIIVDGQNGLLFDPGDHQMLAAKMQLLMGDPDLAERLSLGGRTTAARYDWSTVGPLFCQIICGEQSREVERRISDSAKMMAG
ncbi:MAG: glycosyltransferase family 4 protein [Blastocatellia bacterium]